MQRALIKSAYSHIDMHMMSYDVFIRLQKSHLSFMPHYPIAVGTIRKILLLNLVYFHYFRVLRLFYLLLKKLTKILPLSFLFHNVNSYQLSSFLHEYVFKLFKLSIKMNSMSRLPSELLASL